MKVKVEIHHTTPEMGNTEIISFYLNVKNLQEAKALTETRLEQGRYYDNARYYIIDESGEIIYSNIFL